MNNFIVLYDLMEPPVKITEIFFNEFMKVYKCSFNFIRSKELKLQDLEKSDGVMLIRPQSIFLSAIAKIIKNSGRVLITMYDDDFLAIENFHIRRRIQEKAILKTLQNTNVLFSTNNDLLKKYGNLGKIERLLKTDTGVGIEEIKIRENQNVLDKNNLYKIVYYCNDGTTNVFDNVIGVNIAEIVDKFGDIFEWCFIGTKPYINNCVNKNHVDYIEHLSLDAFRQKLREDNFLFGIAPLEEGEFSKHKYINKFMEFSTAGIPCVYSNVEPYKSFIRNKVDGILCDNTSEDWIEAFNFYLLEVNRERIIKNAQDRIRNDFSIQSISSRMVKIVPELIAENGNKPFRKIRMLQFLFSKVINYFYSCLDPFYRAYGRYKVEGIRSLVQYSLKKVFNYEFHKKN